MTSLSWLIYVAGVVDSIHGIFLALAIISGVTVLINLIYHALTDEIFEVNRFKVTMTAFAIGFGMVAAVIPSHKTVMYIAAAEFGQAVLANPKVGEVANDSVELLQTWIREQTKALKIDAKK